MLLYRLLSFAALAVYTPYALVRSLLGRHRIGDWKGRLGRLPYPDLDGGVWVHAVSVGEVSVGRSLIAEVARREPGRPVGLSATTAAGLELAEKSLGASGVPVFAFPLDLAGPVERALSSVRPGLVLLTETEIWPLFLDRAGALGIPVALVNGRISERSFARYRLVAGPFGRVLARLALFAMQSEEDARRIVSLGAPADRVKVTGNLKYDLAPAPPFPDSERLRSAAAGRPVFVAASTAEGEEELVLEAWRALPEPERPFLAVAPRRPERFGPVADLLRAAGLDVIRRSGAAGGPAGTADGRTGRTASRVYLLDTIGELASLYREGTLAFVGGSLVPRGGHNPIEAWAAGVPVLVGPHTGNFREIVAEGARSGILEAVEGSAQLARALSAALADREALARRSETARRVVEGGRGAVSRTADLVLPLISSSPVSPVSRLPFSGSGSPG